MIDHRGVVRSYRRPFLAVDKGPDDAPLLLGERTLGEIGIDISLRTAQEGGNQWQFRLPVGQDVQQAVKVESAKAFRKRLLKSPRVYALVEYNTLLREASGTDRRASRGTERILRCLLSSKYSKASTLSRRCRPRDRIAGRPGTAVRLTIPVVTSRS